jgi:hypothetical protein
MPTGPAFPLTQDALKKAWQRCLKTARKNHYKECEEAGIEPNNALLKNLRWHELRHEAIRRFADLSKIGH